MFYNEDGSVPFGMSRWENPDCSRIVYGNGRVAVHFNHANQFDNPEKPHGCDRHWSHSAITFDAQSGEDAKLAFCWEHGHSMRVQSLFTGTDFLTVNSTDQDPGNIHAYRFMHDVTSHKDGKTREQNRISYKKHKQNPIVPGPKEGYVVRLGGMFAVSDSEYVIGFAHVPATQSIKGPCEIGFEYFSQNFESPTRRVIFDDGYAARLAMAPYGVNFLVAYVSVAEKGFHQSKFHSSGPFVDSPVTFLLVSPEGELLKKATTTKIHMDANGDFRTLRDGSVVWTM